MRLTTPGGAIVLLNKQGIKLVNSKDTVVANIGLKEDRGVLEINDAAGSKMVEIGSLPSGKGYVLANPYRSIITAEGNPSMLRGGNRR